MSVDWDAANELGMHKYYKGEERKPDKVRKQMYQVISSDRPWTRRELTLRSGPVELAKAVIEQWKIDGCPAKDAEAIEYWKEVINIYENKTKQTW